jgi:apolipoprotein N-acyltransferase
VALCAAACRAAIEAGALLGGLLRPAQSGATRVWLERLGLLALYVGLPSWLLLRATAT